MEISFLLYIYALKLAFIVLKNLKKANISKNHLFLLITALTKDANISEMLRFLCGNCHKNRKKAPNDFGAFKI